MTSQNPVWLNKLGREQVTAVERDRQRREAYSGSKEHSQGHAMEKLGEGKSLEDLVKDRFHTKQTNAIRSGRTHGLEQYKKSDEFRNSKFGQDYLSREE